MKRGSIPSLGPGELALGHTTSSCWFLDFRHLAPWTLSGAPAGARRSRSAVVPRGQRHESYTAGCGRNVTTFQTPIGVVRSSAAQSATSRQRCTLHHLRARRRRGTEPLHGQRSPFTHGHSDEGDSNSALPWNHHSGRTAAPVPPSERRATCHSPTGPGGARQASGRRATRSPDPSHDLLRQTPSSRR